MILNFYIITTVVIKFCAKRQREFEEEQDTRKRMRMLTGGTSEGISQTIN